MEEARRLKLHRERQERRSGNDSRAGSVPSNKKEGGINNSAITPKEATGKSSVRRYRQQRKGEEVGGGDDEFLSSDEEYDEEEASRPGATLVPGPNQSALGTDDISVVEVNNKEPCELNVVNAVAVDEGELDRVRQEAQAELRKELLSNVVTAQSVRRVDEEKESNEEESNPKGFGKCSILLALLCLVVIGATIVALVVLLPPGDESTPSPTQAPDTAGPDGETRTDAPIISPTGSPTTMRPTAFPTSADPCVLDVQLGCDSNVLTPGVEPCEDIELPPLDQCSFDPYEMMFRFNGGGCDQSANLLDRRNDTCQDFGPGVSMFFGDVYYIVVQGIEGEAAPVLLGEYSVPVGGNFSVSATNPPSDTTNLPPTLAITIYADETMETLLQEVTMTTSCTNPVLYLFDRFGSFQYISLQNNVQGPIPPIVPDDFYIYDIGMLLTIRGKGSNRVRLTEATMIVNWANQPVNFTTRIAGAQPLVDQDVSFLLDQQFELDFEIRTQYTAFVTVIGTTTNADGIEEECNDFAIYEFTAGYF